MHIWHWKLFLERLLEQRKSFCHFQDIQNVCHYCVTDSNATEQLLYINQPYPLLPPPTPSPSWFPVVWGKWIFLWWIYIHSDTNVMKMDEMKYNFWNTFTFFLLKTLVSNLLTSTILSILLYLFPYINSLFKI